MGEGTVSISWVSSFVSDTLVLEVSSR
jgi:hypothetical protein